jgi:hypothetical protein
MFYLGIVSVVMLVITSMSIDLNRSVTANASPGTKPFAISPATYSICNFCINQSPCSAIWLVIQPGGPRCIRSVVREAWCVRVAQRLVEKFPSLKDEYETRIAQKAGSEAIVKALRTH